MAYNKYHVSPKAKRTADNILFASKKEKDRYIILKLMERGGEITDLELQPRYTIVINDVKICGYRADFRYKDKNGNIIVEDVKGVRTPDYKIKAKLMFVCQGIKILET